MAAEKAASGSSRAVLKPVKIEINTAGGDAGGSKASGKSAEPTVTCFYETILENYPKRRHARIFKSYRPFEVPQAKSMKGRKLKFLTNEVLGGFKATDFITVDGSAVGKDVIAMELVTVAKGLKRNRPIITSLDPKTFQWKITRCQFPLQLEFKVQLPLSAFQPFSQQFLPCEVEGPSPLKSSLLDEAAQTGDLNLICKDGTTVPAHTAVLAKIPYFAARLKADWSGGQWNMNNRLDVQLPCPVDRHVIDAFLRFAYGDPTHIQLNETSDAASMQDLLSLAEAFDFGALCASVTAHVNITDDNSSSWLEWLKKEHGPNVRNLEEKVKRVVKRSFDEASVWDNATMEELADLDRVVKKRKSTEGPTDASGQMVEV